jgi:drug/metabolite transporter (DMT)-like permease
VNAPAPASAPARPAPRLLVVLGFAVIYVVWGSTYLGIRWAVTTIPPFVMGGTRFLLAGLLLHLFLRLRGRPAPDARQWRDGAIVGLLLLLGGNGLVNWAEQFVPSGLTALIIGSTPLAFVLLEWMLPPRRRPTAATALGLVLGTAGIALLSLQGEATGAVQGWATVALLVACVSWAAGSLYAKRVTPTGDTWMAASLQLMVGGGAQLAVATARGEWTTWQPAAVTLRSGLAWAYLVTIGSLVAFSTYLWLLRVSTPSRVSTYAYVNPVIAVLLGWALAGEAVTPRTLIGAAIVVAAVALLTRPKP